MRIYFSGAHGSGKSTLTRYVSEKYDIHMIPEIARMVLSENEYQIDSLRSNIKLVNDYQSKVFYRLLLEEKNRKSFVSDRSAIDSLAYSASHTQILPQLLKSPELQEYLSILRASDSFIFLVKPSKVTMQADGVREIINWDGAVAIDAQIRLFYEMFDLRYFQINTESMQERVKLINSILSLAK